MDEVAGMSVILSPLLIPMVEDCLPKRSGHGLRPRR
jgi:hypothetical protein